jgi:hypothetical protein
MTLDEAGDRWLRWIIALTVVTVGIAAAHYFLYYLPRAEREKEIHRRMVECREMCAKLDAEIHPAGAKAEGAVASPFEFHYNAKLNKCFYCGRSTVVSGDRMDQMITIVDVYSNKELANYVMNLKSHFETENDRKFKKLKAELFEEKRGRKLS